MHLWFKVFIKRIIGGIESSDAKIKFVCVLILNNLLTSQDGSDKRLNLMSGSEYGLIGKLENLTNEEESNEEIKSYSINIINEIMRINAIYIYKY